MLTLASDASSLVVAPEFGAGMIGWMHGGTPILRRALPQAAAGGDPHAMGCFPLLPYGNRIALGRFHWAGADYSLTPNFGDHPHTIHGIGWQRSWTVEEADGRSVTMALAHRADASWPFAFDAKLAYVLSETTLKVWIELTNRHTGPAPAGIGIHPYFPKEFAPTLRFTASGAWAIGADSLPLRHGPPPRDWQHHEPRAVSESRLDNCFTGWDGSAKIDAGPASVLIEASSVFGQLQVFTPSWADFFCVEPVSHAPDAINRDDIPADQAMQVLEPNATIGGWIRFTPTSKC
jgi:aldose 1-epimerase